jgi:hypothetical protein
MNDSYNDLIEKLRSLSYDDLVYLRDYDLPMEIARVQTKQKIDKQKLEQWNKGEPIIDHSPT